MDAIEIEVFLTLAEELHFGHTAQRLHLPQPRVSRLVASLERQVGGALLERTSRRVTLTPLGELLRDRAGPAYAELRAALEEVRDRARGTSGRLRLGCLVTTTAPALTRLAEEFQRRHPDWDLTLHDVGIVDPYGSLRGGRIDVLANWLVVDEPDLTAGPVLEYRDRVLLVGRHHRLAGRESVSIEDLADEAVLGNPAGYPAVLFDSLVPPATPAGRPVRRTAHTAGSMGAVLTLIALGQIVHPTVAGISAWQRDDLAQIPIRDMPPLPLGLIWHTARENERIRALAAVARDLFADGLMQPAMVHPRASEVLAKTEIGYAGD
jgi:DNA-binding transcriptional LysR family regulator